MYPWDFFFQKPDDESGVERSTEHRKFNTVKTWLRKLNFL